MSAIALSASLPLPASSVPGAANKPPTATSSSVDKSSAASLGKTDPGEINSGAINPGEINLSEINNGAGKPGATKPAGAAVGGDQALTAEQQQQLAELAARDREVRAHEAAHANIGGVHAGAPTYTYTRGPDGNSYAVAGEVSIDVSPVPGDPQATIAKAQLVRRAALAPAQPSAQDRSVASAAVALEQAARQELQALGRAGEGDERADHAGAVTFAQIAAPTAAEPGEIISELV